MLFCGYYWQKIKSKYETEGNVKGTVCKEVRGQSTVQQGGFNVVSHLWLLLYKDEALLCAAAFVSQGGYHCP